MTDSTPDMRSVAPDAPSQEPRQEAQPAAPHAPASTSAPLLEDGPEAAGQARGPALAGPALAGPALAGPALAGPALAGAALPGVAASGASLSGPAGSGADGAPGMSLGIAGAAESRGISVRGSSSRRKPRPLGLDEVFAHARRKPAPVTNVVAQSPRLKRLLRDTLLFRQVPAPDFERFFDLLRWRHVSAGSRLLAGGERSPWVFLLAEGTAKVHHESASGAQVIYSICGPGEVLGEMSAVDGEAHSATVTMLEPSLLGAVDREEFLSFLLCVPQASLNIAAITSRRLRAATARIQSLSRLDVTGRLAAQLLLFAAHYGQSPRGTDPDLLMERFDPQRAALDRVGAERLALNVLGRGGATSGPQSGVAIDLHLRQSDLADLIGASRVRVNQALHQMRRSGHITVQGNRITLLDLEALRTRCQ